MKWHSITVLCHEPYKHKFEEKYFPCLLFTHSRTVTYISSFVSIPYTMLFISFFHDFFSVVLCKIAKTFIFLLSLDAISGLNAIHTLTHNHYIDNSKNAKCDSILRSKAFWGTNWMVFEDKWYSGISLYKNYFSNRRNKEKENKPRYFHFLDSCRKQIMKLLLKLYLLNYFLNWWKWVQRIAEQIKGNNSLKHKVSFLLKVLL